jgi:zinc transporter ZupT
MPHSISIQAGMIILRVASVLPESGVLRRMAVEIQNFPEGFAKAAPVDKAKNSQNQQFEFTIVLS